MKRRAAKEPAAEPEPEAGRDAEAEAEASPLKRAKTSAKASASKRKGVASGEAAAVEPAGGVDTEGAPAAEKKPARARKPRAKAAAAKSDDAPALAGDAGGAGGGAEAAAQPEQEPSAGAKPKAKRAKKESAPALPVYTMDMRKPPPPEGSKVLKILSWNVAGLRALIKKTPDALSRLVEREGFEVVCLQEHKLQGDHTAELERSLGLQGWSHHWACSTAKLGYSGVSVHTRAPPLSVTIGLGPAADGLGPDPEHEGEGRVVTVELQELFVVSVYVPNSGEGLRRLDYRVKRWDGALADFVRRLEARGKPVVLTGDLNCAHKEIDIHAPKSNLRSAGFTIEERESFGRLLLGEAGMADSFRRMFPDTVAYTYFTRRFNCREQNKGWRLDYFLTSSTMMPVSVEDPAAEAEAAAAKGPAPLTPWCVYDTWIHQDVYGSDHLPLGLTLVRNAE